MGSASCSSPLSPQQWALGLAASLPVDARIKFKEWYTSVDFETKASVDPCSEVLSQGSPATPQQADPVSSTPIVTTSAGSNFRAANVPCPSQRAEPYAAAFHTEGESFKKEFVLGVGACHGRPSRAGFRGLHDGRFSRRVSLGELRGRGLMKGCNLRFWNGFQDGRRLRPMAVKLAHNWSRSRTALRA